MAEESLLAEIAKNQLGVSVYLKDRVITVGPTPERILENNPRRVQLLISCPGAGGLVIGFSPEGVDQAGIAISAGGGIFAMNVREDGDAVGYEVWAKSDTLTTTFYVVELIARE